MQEQSLFFPNPDMIGESISEALCQIAYWVECEERISAPLDIKEDSREPEERRIDGLEELQDIDTNNAHHRGHHDPQIEEDHGQDHVYRQLQPVYAWHHAQEYAHQYQYAYHDQIYQELRHDRYHRDRRQWEFHILNYVFLSVDMRLTYLR